MDDGLIDRIYEAAFVPTLWPGLLQDLASIADARGGVFFAASTRVLNWTASPDLQEIFTAYVQDGWLRRCTRRACWLCETRPGFLVEQDVWTAAELDENPIYRDFLRPRGLGWSAGMALPLPTGDTVVFSFEREWAKGPIEPAGIARLDALRPHLARSALMAARLHLEQAKSAGDMLAALGLPALVVTADGVVLAANTLLPPGTGTAHWRPGTAVAFADPAANALLQAALSGLRDGTHHPLSFPLRDQPGAPARIVHVIPLRGSAQAIMARAASVIAITPVTLPLAPPQDLIRSLFDLTPAEARVAAALAVGQTIEDIADQGGVSRNTIRSQLGRLMEKMGCSRQAEVVALLSGLTLGHLARPSGFEPLTRGLEGRRSIHLS